MADKIVSSTAAGGGTGSLASPYTEAEARALGGSNRFLYRAGTYLLSLPKNVLVGGTGLGNETVWQPYGDGDVVFKDNSAPTTHQPFFKFLAATDTPSGTADWFIIDGRPYAGGGGNGRFEFDGNAYNSNMPFQIFSRQHLTFRNIYTHHVGGNGLFNATKSDYLTVVSNLIGPFGHPSRTTGSGWSMNASGVAYTPDAYDGFHNVCCFNVIVGGEGEPSDGNGFIWDNGGGASTIAVPSTLMYGNIAAYNGGRGFHILRVKPVTGGKILVLANTSLLNCLDLSSATMSGGSGAEFDIDGGSGADGEADFANNLAIAMASTAGPGAVNFGATPFRLVGSGAVIRSYNNRFNGGTTAGAWASVTAGALPTSVATLGLTGGYPAVDTADGQYHLRAPNPALLAPWLAPISSSVLKDAGIDPTTITGLNANMLSDLGVYYPGVDLVGHKRPF